MHRAKLRGQRPMVRGFDRQVAGLLVRVAVLNGFTALGIPVTRVAGSVRPGAGAVRPSAALCNKAVSSRRVSETIAFPLLSLLVCLA